MKNLEEHEDLNLHISKRFLKNACYVLSLLTLGIFLVFLTTDKPGIMTINLFLIAINIFVYSENELKLYGEL